MRAEKELARVVQFAEILLDILLQHPVCISKMVLRTFKYIVHQNHRIVSLITLFCFVSKEELPSVNTLFVVVTIKAKIMSYLKLSIRICIAICAYLRLSEAFIPHSQTPRKPNTHTLNKNEILEKSVAFYASVSREEKQRERGLYVPYKEDNAITNKIITAKVLYLARSKIKKGNLDQAERLYRKHINDLEQSNDQCDHTQLAVSVLLLTLLLQRKPDSVKETRSAFVNFFRTVTSEHERENGQLKECICSAKVLQAFALFEMRQGNKKKAVKLAEMAVEMDPELEPILKWKQFQLN